jgi:pyruvate dehydrogenase E2 component (dihydrolipoamide acetyltransferase)
MAYVLIMPRQGNTVESCIIDEWKLSEGAPVQADTPICVVETDKATFEVPAGEAGTILKLLYPAGEDVPVLKPIAVIGQAGEDWQAALEKAGGDASPAAGAAASSGAASSAAGAASPAAAASSVAASTGPGGGPPNSAASGGIPEGGQVAASPRARNLADHEGLFLATASGSGPGGRIIERDVQAALDGRPGLTAAARGAAASGAPLPAQGSGLGGRITAGDIAVLPAGAASGAALTVGGAALPTAALGEGAVSDTPIKGVRKLIADRMYQSLAESAQFTLSGNASAVKLQEIRGRMKNSGGFLAIAGGGGSKEAGAASPLAKITVNDLILFAVSRMLPRFPFMNAHKIGDTLRTFERVHLGVAVDTPRGLMVPVIRNANFLSLAQISAEAKRLATACQGGTVNPDELSGSTFTVTNLGSLGVSAFTPVLNAPEVGILGVCGIELKPVEDEGACGFSFEPHIGFSLTINHQVVDGAPAARFLKALGDAVAEIDLLLAAG